MSKLYKNDAKLGIVNFTYPAPKGMSRFEGMLWQMKEIYDMGCELYQFNTRGLTDDEAKQAKEKMAEYGFEYEGNVPRSIFDLAGFRGADAVKAKELFEEGIAAYAADGVKIVRGGYGRLRMEYSRWNLQRGFSGPEQMENLIACFIIAAPILEKYNVYYGIENHLDFTGAEFDKIFTAVNSPFVGCAYDTANGLFLNTDPNLDIDHMAKWAITTHIKDSKIVNSPFNGPDGPMVPVGCALGDGNVNVKACLDAILAKSPMKDGIHLILETGWFGKAVHDANEDMDAYNRQILRQSMQWLKGYITK